MLFAAHSWFACDGLDARRREKSAHRATQHPTNCPNFEMVKFAIKQTHPASQEDQIRKKESKRRAAALGLMLWILVEDVEAVASSKKVSAQYEARCPNSQKTSFVAAALGNTTDTALPSACSQQILWESCKSLCFLQIIAVLPALVEMPRTRVMLRSRSLDRRC